MQSEVYVECLGIDRHVLSGTQCTYLSYYFTMCLVSYLKW
jgi:hypothetical protein